MIIHDVEQGTQEWLDLRLGKITASEFHTLMGDSSTKKTLLLKKAAERITGKASDSDRFSNIHTERGHEKEDDARQLYAVLNMVDVDEVGFIEYNKNLGCSPDGLVGDDGGVEIKCKDNHTHLFAVMKNYVEPSHKTQCQFNMMVSNRKWWDYCLYNDNFSNPCHIIRLPRDEEYINKMKAEIEKCESIIESHIRNFNNILEGK